ncbi:MAG TPA: hypothetical protein VF216_05510 [Mizugakiibacter sp.]
MNRIIRLTGRLGLIVAGFGFVVAAQAQNASSETQRNVDQQQRIEQGLQSGQLTTREAAGLEQGEAHVDRVEQRDLRDGSLSARDQAQIQRAQNRESAAIYRQKHDTQTGNPASISSQRMQADVQRNLDQQQRIHDGAANGTLTDREVAHLQGREAHASHLDARAGANGRVGAREQAHIQHTDNRDSRRIHRQKHDGQQR